MKLPEPGVDLACHRHTQYASHHRSRSNVSWPDVTSSSISRLRPRRGARRASRLARHAARAIGLPEPPLQWNFVTLRALLSEKRACSVTTFESTSTVPPGAPAGAWREQPLPGSGLVVRPGLAPARPGAGVVRIPQAILRRHPQRAPGAAADDAVRCRAFITRTCGASSGVDVGGTRATFAVHGNKGSFIKYGLDPQEAALNRPPADEAGWDAEPPEMYGRLTTPEESRTIRDHTLGLHALL